MANEIKSVMMSAIVFSMIMAGMGGIITDASTQGNYTITKNVSSLNHLSQLDEQMQSVKEKLQESTQESSVLYQLGGIVVGGGIEASRLFLSSFSLFFDIITEVEAITHIPSWLISGITVLLTTTLVFGVWQIFLRDRI